MANVIRSPPPPYPILDLTIHITPTPERSDVNCALDPSPTKRAAVDLIVRRMTTSYSHVNLCRLGTRFRVWGNLETFQRGGHAGKPEQEMSQKFNSKSFRARHEKIQDAFERDDAAVRRRSGGGEKLQSSVV